MNGNANCTSFFFVSSGIHTDLFRPNGVTFTAPAGTTEFAQKWQPKQGDIVTFKHRGYLLATKKPKFPTLFRVRHDLNWDTVVQNWEDKKFSVTPSMCTLLSWNVLRFISSIPILSFQFFLCTGRSTSQKDTGPIRVPSENSSVNLQRRKGLILWMATTGKTSTPQNCCRRYSLPPQSPSFHMLS